MRTIMSQLAQAWQEELTEAERETWITYANAVTVRNKLGDTIKLTGQNWFIRNNSVWMQMSQEYDTSITNVKLDIGPPPGAISFVYTEEEGENPATLVANWSIPTSFPSPRVGIWISRPKSPTVNYYKGPYQYLRYNQSTSTSGPIIPPYGWEEGEKIFFRFRARYTDGRLSDAVEIGYTLPGPVLPEEE